jgi:hypothetical protein
MDGCGWVCECVRWCVGGWVAIQGPVAKVKSGAVVAVVMAEVVIARAQIEQELCSEEGAEQRLRSEQGAEQELCSEQGSCSLTLPLIRREQRR